MAAGRPYRLMFYYVLRFVSALAGLAVSKLQQKGVAVSELQQ